jgi:hypothetical protein
MLDVAVKNKRTMQAPAPRAQRAGERHSPERTNCGQIKETKSEGEEGGSDGLVKKWRRSEPGIV